MQLVSGKPLPWKQAFKIILGEDLKWWWLPSKPVLRVNYLEKTFGIDKVEKFKEGRLAEEVFAELEYD